MLYIVIDDNGTKKREPLTGIGYGMPLGAVVILANNTILPDGYLLCDGSTFDETVYPALYAYLGTDTLPVYQTSSGDYKAIKATPAGSGDISDVGALIRKANPDWIVLNASVTSGYEIPGLLDAISAGAIGFELIFAPYSETPTAYVTEKCIKVAGLTSQGFRLDANAAYGMNTTSIDWTTGVLSGNYVNIYAWRPIYGVIA